MDFLLALFALFHRMNRAVDAEATRHEAMTLMQRMIPGTREMSDATPGA
jgi:hypothetical protein